VLLQKAVDASVLGHLEVMRSVKPGMREYEIQALVEYVFTRCGCEYAGYPSIVGAGANGTILHYEDDRALIKNGDMIVMDAAGEYHGYSADVTRTFPANGKFSPEQRSIYDLVLEAQNAGINEIRPGKTIGAFHNACSKVLAAGLVKLGIIKQEREVGRYFMHGAGHPLGLDVHDDWGTNRTLKAGMTMTCEPGIYIKSGSPCDPKWWNIGCRIEDDMIVTDGDPIMMSRGAPRKAEEIETLMLENGIGNIPLRPMGKD
jgi:Xaa-Pro aminopeptidase